MESNKTLEPMPGLKIWRNPKNQFVVFELHYTADPEKRDPSYIEPIRLGMPVRKFKQEYELQWENFEGVTVYADYDEKVHGVNGPIAPHIGLPLLIGMDFGLTPALLVAQLQEDCLCALQEFTAVNMGAERFLAWVTPQLRLKYPLWADYQKDYLAFIDPSGEFRKDTDEGTCAKVVDSYGFKNIIPGAIAWEERRTAVEHFLTRRTKNGPCFKVSLPNCPVLVRGFQGGYRYPEKAIDIEPNKLRPIKDNHSHIQDALQMIATRVTMRPGQQSVTVPTPGYSWAQPHR